MNNLDHQAKEYLALALCGVSSDEIVTMQGKRVQSNLERSHNLSLGRAGVAEFLTALGFVIGERVDNLFTAVTFPEGWQVKRTDHYMWSDLVDPKGHKRAGIFFKPEFYDRKAHMSLCTRYSVKGDYSDANMKDGDRIDRRRFLIDNTTDQRIMAFDGDCFDPLSEEAKAKLAAILPDIENPLAYWDDAPITPDDSALSALIQEGN